MLEEKVIQDTFKDFFSWWKSEAKDCKQDTINIVPSDFSIKIDNQVRVKVSVPDLSKQSAEISADYILVSDYDTLEVECTKRMSAEAMGVDVETFGLDPYIHKIRLLQIATKGFPVMIIDVWKFQTFEPVKKLLQGPGLKIFQNGKFDLKMLYMAGLPVEGPLFDTMIVEQLILGDLMKKGEKSNLKDLAKKYLNVELSKEQQKSSWTGDLSDEQLIYASKDAAILLVLRDILWKQLVKCELGAVATLEFDCLYSVADLELNGFFLNRDKQAIIKDVLRAEVVKAEEEIRAELGGINLNSHPQVLSALQEKTGLTLESTGKDYLLTIGHPIFFKLINYREKSKFLKDNFLQLPENIHPVTGRIHAQYFQIGAATGRFTCKDPALQTIPRDKRIRECFNAEAGNKLVVADYSQIELRIAAEISKDPVMIKAYASGEDLHTLTACSITGKLKDQITKDERQLAKAVNFGLIYGAGAKTLMGYAKTNYGIDLSLADAERFRKKFFRLYMGVRRWHDKVYSRKKNITYTIGGRPRKFNKRYKFKLTDRLNSPVQGSGADILKKAMVLLRPRMKGLAKIVHIVHDEIILETPAGRAEEVKKILEETMKEAGQYYLKLVPVEVECHICDSWAEK